MNHAEQCALPLPTPDGEFVAHYSAKGLCGLDFPEKGTIQKPGSVPAQIATWHKLTAAALGRALAGQSPEPLPPLDLSSGTDFRQRVWQALRDIPAGQTRSYGEVAAAVQQPNAMRAVGGACGANPIPVLVPCHRVLAAHGQIGGFSGPPKWKRLLLEREGSWPKAQPELIRALPSSAAATHGHALVGGLPSSAAATL